MKKVVQRFTVFMLFVCASLLSANPIPSSVENFIFDKASASGLQQAEPMSKQPMCKHMGDADSCKNGDAGAVKSEVFNRTWYHCNSLPFQGGDPQVCEKIYILFDQLAITQQGIFIKLDERWCETKALFSDAKGIFIRPQDTNARGCRDGYEPCRNCDRCINENYNICPFCHKPARN